MVEHLGLASLGGGNQVLVQDAENILADLGELGLDPLAVFLDEGNLGGVAFGLLLLLNRGDDPPRGTASANNVLVGNRQEVPLLDGKIAVFGGNNLHVLNHLCARGEESAGDSADIRYPSGTCPRSARPARPAWPDRQHLRDPC